MGWAPYSWLFRTVRAVEGAGSGTHELKARFRLMKALGVGLMLHYCGYSTPGYP